MKYTKPYLAPTLTVDLVLFQVINSRLHVLLINRPHDPFRGHWALPGGYVPAGETTLEALTRICEAKASIDTGKLTFLKQFTANDSIARDPRGHAVAMIYLGIVDKMSLSKSPDETAFFPIDDLPDNLAFDHVNTIYQARDFLRDELNHTTIANAFLPPLFTFTELLTVYEAIFSREFDRRNFYTIFMRRGVLVETDKLYHHPTSRPAKLYKFNSTKVVPFSNSLD